MSVSGISGSNFFAGYNSTPVQNKFRQIQQGFQQLGQDLQSGNLSQAQSDFSTLQQDLKQLQEAGGGHHHHARPENSQASSQQSGVPSLFASLGQALQSGNLTAAQQTYSTLQQDFLQFSGGATSSGAGGSNTSTSGTTSLNVSA